MDENEHQIALTVVTPGKDVLVMPFKNFSVCREGLLIYVILWCDCYYNEFSI